MYPNSDRNRKLDEWAERFSKRWGWGFEQQRPRVHPPGPGEKPGSQQMQKMLYKNPWIPTMPQLIRIVNLLWFAFNLYHQTYAYDLMHEGLWTHFLNEEIPGIKYFEWGCAYYQTEFNCEQLYNTFCTDHDFYKFQKGYNEQQELFKKFVSNKNHNYRFFYSKPTIIFDRDYPPLLKTPVGKTITINI